MTEVVIIDAIRTPIGALGGSLSSIRADDMAAKVIKAIVERNHLDTSLVEEVYFGCANQAGEDNRNVARMASLLAGLPVEVPGVTFNRLCASGLNAVNQAVRAIKAGEGEIFIAGGVENMSRAPYSVPKGEKGYPWGNLTMWDTTLGWRYPNPVMADMHGTEQMGQTAENIASMKPEITREIQDAFSVRSHQNAISAIDNGTFSEEILPIDIPQRKGEPKVFDTDERPRRDTNMKSLARLRPAFRKEGGTVTAGNSSGLNDGAAALLVMSAEKAAELDLKPMARVLGSAAAGVPPRIMGMGPVPATQKVLNRTGLKLSDINLIELNEAFASQSTAIIRELDLNTDILNVNGGAIALGHPLGATGAKLTTQLIYEMKRRQVQLGMVSMCIGGGMGAAGIFENVE